MWECLVRASCASVAAVSLSGVATAQTPVQAPSMTVCLVLSPRLAIDPGVTKMARSEVQTIWKVLGVEIRSAEHAGDGCNRIVVVKADHEALPEDLSHQDALGWVPFAGGHARQLVFLRVSRARLMTAGAITGVNPDGLKDLMFAKLLGRTVAHELGHVLLDSPGHADFGLMRASYRANDVLRVPASAYTLNAAERARLFTLMAVRARIAAQ